MLRRSFRATEISSTPKACGTIDQLVIDGLLVNQEAFRISEIVSGGCVLAHHHHFQVSGARFRKAAGSPPTELAAFRNWASFVYET